MPLRVHDTRRREKVPFQTMEPGKVSMYVCGVTVYDKCHLGHARCYLSFDLIHRWLEASGYDVHYVQNFTDIDDKIIKRANETGEDWRKLVDENIAGYYEDMDALNILRADDYPRCTEYVDDMIRITEDLIAKGHAYSANDGVYFEVNSAPEKYGQLTGKTLTQFALEQVAESKIPVQGKKITRILLCGSQQNLASRLGILHGDQADLVGTLSTAMSLDHFGQQFDIHGGGHDLRFPHHEAEIFQGECHTGCSPIVHHWLHNGFVNIDGEKMSKSLGNFWTIRDILQQIDAMVLRFALINAHYRSPIDMNESLLKDAERNYNRVLECYISALKSRTTQSPVALPQPDITSQQPLTKSLAMLEKMGEGFAQAMDDDFNSRDAVAKVLGGVREISKILNSGLDEADRDAFSHYAVDWLEESAGAVLGILPTREFALIEPEEDPRRAKIAPRVEELLVKRSEARANKDWAKADQIRDELNSMGVIVTDSADGPNWDLA